MRRKSICSCADNAADPPAKDGTNSNKRRRRSEINTENELSLSFTTTTTVIRPVEAVFENQDIFTFILSSFVAEFSGHVDGTTIRSIFLVSRRWYHTASSAKLWRPASGIIYGENPLNHRPSTRPVSMPMQPKAVFSLSASLQDQLIGFANLGPIPGASLRRVRERATGKDYAVKVPYARRDGNDNDLSSSVLREMALLSRCADTEYSTPRHLCLMKESLSVHGKFVRWYDCADMTLEDLIDRPRGRPLSMTYAQDILRQMLAGVQELHVRGAVHQNLAPRHIMLYNVDHSRRQELVVKIGGLSSVSINTFPRGACTSSSRGETIVYDRKYQAPEILLGQNYCDGTVDIWSIGCIFAQMMRGGAPLFSGQSIINQLFQIFRVVGSPSKRVSPTLISLPYYHQDLFPVWQENHLGGSLPLLSRVGLDLVRKLLFLDPDRRITAGAAMSHPFLDENGSLCTTELRGSSASIGICIKASSLSCRSVTKAMAKYLQRGEADPSSLDTYQTLVQSDKWATLVDWIIEVGDVFDKSPRSAFLAMQYFIQFVAQVKIGIKRYQLVAAACLRLASASEDTDGIKAEDMVFSADRTFIADELVALERFVLEKIRGSFGQPLAYDFVSMYLDVVPEIRNDSKVRHLSRYISELALQSGNYRDFKPSQLGASIVLLSLICADRSQVWPKSIQRVSGYSIETLEASVVSLSINIDRVAQTLPRLKVVTKRFKKVERERVAAIQIPVMENLQDYMNA